MTQSARLEVARSRHRTFSAAKNTFLAKKSCGILLNVETLSDIDSVCCGVCVLAPIFMRLEMEFGHHSPNTEVSEANIQEANEAYTRSERSSLKSFYGVTVLSPGSNFGPIQNSCAEII